MRNAPWDLPPEEVDENAFKVMNRLHTPTQFELPDEDTLDDLWTPVTAVGPDFKPPSKAHSTTADVGSTQPLLLAPSLTQGLQKPPVLAAVQEESTKLIQLVDMLLPQVKDRLLFASGDPFWRDSARKNTFHRVLKAEVIDELRMLLPERKKFSVRSKDLREIFEIFRAELNVGSVETAFNTAPGLVNARNGVVCIDRGKPYLLECDPEVRFTYFINADFDPRSLDAGATAWEGFCATSLEQNFDKRCQLAEYIGYALSDCIDAKVIMFLTGASNSGKSVILRVLNALLPETEVTCFPLHEIGNQFNGQQLCQAKLNVSYETDAEPLVVDAMLKALSGGGDRIAAARKFCDAKTMRPKTKLICAANTLPELATGDTSNAFLNRIEVLPFTVEIPKEEQDPNLEKALWNERDTIFTEAMYAVARLLYRGCRFTRCDDAVREIERYRTSANSFLSYETESLDYSPELLVGCAELYAAYVAFCNSANFAPFSKTKFRRMLMRKSAVTEGSPRINGRQVRCYLGVGFKNKEEE